MKHIIDNFWARSRKGTRVGDALPVLREGIFLGRQWLGEAAAAIVAAQGNQPAHGMTTARDAAQVAFRTNDPGLIDAALTRAAAVIDAIQMGLMGRVEIVDASHPIRFERTLGQSCTQGYVNKGTFSHEYGRIHINFHEVKRNARISPTRAPQVVAWTFVHEATHKFARTKDKGYTLQQKFWTLDFQNAIRNADSHTLFIYLAATPVQGMWNVQPNELPIMW